ncbi:MAG: penicillin-binding transpeptidase domain-containing protein [bacterium]|nr:penicillin-binding transpeptidase domain-containing protein [bacterium]
MRKNENADEKAKKRRFNHKMQASLLLVFCIVIVLFIILIGRLFWLNSRDGERYKKSVLSQQSYTYSMIPYKRGDILDTNGTVLAKSVKVYNLILDPASMLAEKKGEQAYVEPTIRELKKVFNVDEEKIRKLLEEKPESRYYVYQKGYSYDEMKEFQEIMDNNAYIKGVWFEDDYVRTYPYSSLASKTLGFTFKGNVGSYGIEGYYNDELNGTNGATYGYYNSDNDVEDTVKQPTNGYNVVSTLDINIQKIVQNHIDKFNEEIGSKNTSVIVMDPNSGEVLSMAESVTYDPNNPTDLSSLYSEAEVEKMTDDEALDARNLLWRNSTISDNFEPGSTIKALTVAAALDEGIITKDSTFVCDGKQVVAKNTRAIKCAKRDGHGKITLEEVLAYSCNDAIMQISEKMKSSLFIKYQTDFSLGKQSGIDLSGESIGQVYNQDNMGPVELATSSFGQSMSVPMIQVISAFSSVINGGYYYTPHVVKQITTEEGSVVRNVKSEYTRQVISEETSKLVRNYMRQTVVKGTAKSADIEGYEIAGKTGTAEKIPRGQGNYVVSFMGYAPASDPKVVVYVTIDEPQGEGNASKSALACELARDIMKDIFPYLNIYPTVEVKSTDDANKDKDKTQSTASPTATPASTKEPVKNNENDDYNGSDYDYDVLPEDE